MKNIHILQTDKPSRLRIGSNFNFVLGLTQSAIVSKNDSYTNRHIYITSDEEIKEGDWVKLFVKHIDKEWIHKITKEDLLLYTDFNNEGAKIILTTDGDLINEGIQAIDDEFLEWFVKNPSCEEIGVLTNNMKNADYIEVAERLYKYINPTSKMDCPNSVYITTEKWYYEWLNIETDLDLFDWCVKFKNK